MLTLHTIKPARGAKKKRKRVGRGNSSGHGTYSTRGQKGQRSRSGGKKRLKYIGLKALVQKVPKSRGFKSHRPEMFSFNLGKLDKIFNNGDKITPQILLKKKLIKSIKPGVKILGDGKLTKKFTIQADGFSKSAVEKITKAGGKVEIIKKLKKH